MKKSKLSDENVHKFKDEHVSEKIDDTLWNYSATSRVHHTDLLNETSVKRNPKLLVCTSAGVSNICTERQATDV
jgi:DNA polymerase IIIc chi subunit